MRFTTALVLYSVRTELHLTIKIECVSHSFRHAQKRLCQARFPQVSHTENTHTRWDCLQTRTLLGTLKTHMFSKIKFKSCALFGTHIRRTYLVRLTSRPRTRIDTQNNAHIKRDWLQHSHPIRHAQKRTCQIKWNCFKFRTIFSSHRKRTYQVISPEVPHSIRHARNAHVKWEWLLTLCSARSENTHVN